MKQRDIRPLFIDSSDAPIAPGNQKLLFRAQLYVEPAMLKSVFHYECYPVHRETLTGYWIRGRNGSFGENGEYKPALAFVRKHPDFGPFTAFNSCGFAQETKELARLALAVRFNARLNILKNQKEELLQRIAVLKERNPELILILHDEAIAALEFQPVPETVNECSEISIEDWNSLLTSHRLRHSNER